MIGLILISHAHIASETKIAAEHILGPQPLFETVDIPDSDATQEQQKKFTALIQATDLGQGVLIMADVFGGTPCNMALESLAANKVEVISGFNMPAVIKALTLRCEDVDLELLVQECMIAGQQYICKGSDYYTSKKVENDA
ncbi:MAG: PTS sugar transporter subunit IIA [Mariprofundaceae bacterium]|nr:PTS sugar transporter subunit IIA [Mariprofundaceae bacterium]